jgi:hypothetical protein
MKYAFEMASGWHDIHTKFRENMYRGIYIILGYYLTVWDAAVLVLLNRGIYEICC